MPVLENGYKPKFLSSIKTAQCVTQLHFDYNHAKLQKDISIIAVFIAIYIEKRVPSFFALQYLEVLHIVGKN